MKFICTQRSLAQGLQIVCKAISEHKIDLIQSYVLIEAKEDRLRFVSFDGSFGMEVLVEATVFEEGVATVKANIFQGWVSGLKQEMILVSKTKAAGKMVLEDRTIPSQLLQCKAGSPDDIQGLLDGGKKKAKVSAEFNGMLATEFLKLGTDDNGEVLINETSFEISSNVLMQGIQYCAKSVYSEDDKPFLTGIHARLKGGWIEFMGTNGHRLSLFRANAPEVQSLGITIPGKTLDKVRPLLNDIKNKDIKASLMGKQGAWHTLVLEYCAYEDTENGRQYCQDNGWWKCYLRLLSNTPAYPVIIVDNIAKNFQSEAIIDRLELVQTLDRVRIIVDQLKEVRSVGAGLVLMEFGSQSLTLFGNAGSSGNTEEELEIEFTGSPGCMAVDIYYVLGGLKLIQSEKVRLQFNEPLRPMLISPVGEDEPEFLYQVAAVQIKDGRKKQ